MRAGDLGSILRITVNECDLPMDPSVRKLKVLLDRRPFVLSKVFIAGRYVDGADEIWFLHKPGELRRIVEGFLPANTGCCEACGGMGFVLCRHCSGSHKRYTDKGGFRTYTVFNENGIVRCPDCYLLTL